MVSPSGASSTSDATANHEGSVKAVLAALKRARDQVKELNTTISIIGKLVGAIAMVENQLKSSLEKQVGKPIIDKLHSFLIQESMKTTRVVTPSPAAIPVPFESTIPAATNIPDIPTNRAQDEVPPTPAPPKQPRWADVAATPLQFHQQTSHTQPPFSERLSSSDGSHCE